MIEVKYDSHQMANGQFRTMFFILFNLDEIEKVFEVISKVKLTCIVDLDIIQLKRYEDGSFCVTYRMFHDTEQFGSVTYDKLVWRMR